MFDMQQYLRNKNALSPDLAVGGDGPDLEGDDDEDEGPLSSPKQYTNNEDGYNQPKANTQLDAPPAPSAPAPTASGPNKSYNLSDTYKELQSLPVGEAQQKYRTFLDDNAPDRSDYSPSKTQRIAAILSGISAGAQGKDGFSAARGVLDEPYQAAMANYKLQGDKLAKSADLEEKDISNRVKTFRDIEEAKAKSDTNARLGKYNDAQIKDIQSKIDTRAADLKTKGYVTKVNKNDGHMYATKVNPASPDGFDQIDLGKYDLTSGEQITNAGRKAKAVSDAEEPNKERLAKFKSDETDNRIDKRLKNAEALIKFKNENAGYTYKVTGNTITAFGKDGTSFDTGIDSGKLTDQQKIDLGIKAKNKRVTTTVNGNQRTTDTEYGNPEQVKPIAGNDAMEAVSTDGGKTWKARKKAK